MPFQLRRQAATFDSLWPIAALLLATLIAYLPAWHGGPLWDDEAHLTREALRSWDGLRRIWFDLGATQQYYPVVHSAFWLQHRLWGDATLGYHIVNIALHALSAGLLAVLLKRLEVPGAALAGVIFALHPVHVESVAWLTELKNTLSGFFVLSAFLVYLRFDERRDARRYGAALLLFVLALLSKSVTAVLPPALLVVFWWKRGTLDFRRDVVPLAPFFVLGIAAGLLTAWVERTLIGAQGAEFDFSAVERMLIAGRVFWFYLGKLAYPANLMFTYPRWEIGAAMWWQYLYPFAAIGLVIALWTLRWRTRGPLAAVLLYGGLLFPVLGFVNVYPFRYSFVADHFVYLASIPVIALVAAGIARAVERQRLSGAALMVGIVAIATALGVLTHAQSRYYADAETLYRHVLDRNPSSWMAHNNLGKLLIETNPPDALKHFDEALRLRPGTAEAWNNRGRILHGAGRVRDAIADYRKAIALDPAVGSAHNNLCVALFSSGDAESAVHSCREAVRLMPDDAQAHFNLGRALSMLGRAEAADHFRTALTLRPSYAEAHNDLGTALDQMGRADEALAHYREAVRLNPRLALAHNNIGIAMQRRGRVDEAIVALREAVRLDPRYADAQFNLANLLQASGRVYESVPHYEAALLRNPTDASAHNNLGLALEALGRRAEAAAHYREAIRLRPDFAQARENVARVTRQP